MQKSITIGRAGAAALFAGAALIIGVGTALAATTVVTPASMNGWYFYNDQNDTVLGTSTDHGFAAGPGTPPAGTGSVHLTKTATDKYGIATAQFASTSLSDITTLKYSTYRASGTPAQAPSLGFDIDSDTTDADTSYQGRLTYEPYFTQAVSTGAWQAWDTLNDAAGTGTGNWWFSHATLSGGAASVCTQANPCTWSELKAAYPHAAMRSPGQLILRTNGADNEAFDGNADNLVVGISGIDTTFDFDPAAASTSAVKVTIDKFIDGSMATASSSGGSSFPMQSSWDAANLGGAGSGTYDLGPAGSNSPNAYEAVTSDMDPGSDYATNEVTGGPVVGAACADGMPYALNGYSVGDTLSEAQSAATTTQSPAFSNLTSDKFVIVWNESCAATSTPPTAVPPANACDAPDSAPAGYTLENGTSGNDKVTLAPNTMFVGHGGNDRVVAGAGNYIVCTGGGNDTIALGNGNSTIDAGNGNNKITVGNGEGAIKAGNGNDNVVAGNGVRAIDAGDGNNKVTTGDQAQTITAGSGNDGIRAGGGNDTVNAGDGNNRLWGEGGDDLLVSGSGNDKVDGGAGTDTCQAGGGNNVKSSCEL